MFFTLTEAPDGKVRVNNLPSAVAASSSACLAIFKKTSSRVASPSWMYAMPYSLSILKLRKKILYLGRIPQKSDMLLVLQLYRNQKKILSKLPSKAPLYHEE